MRIEDTDRERSTSEAVEAIMESLKWLGLEASEPPIFQTDRFDRYNHIIAKLIEQGDAYRCFCSTGRIDKLREAQRAAGEKPRYDRHCRELEHASRENEPHVVRLKTPLTGVVEFDDLVRGRLGFDNQELDDLVIKRTDGSPTYNLSVVVDDADSNISCVIRGDDHINNTPRQINIYKALGWSIPRFAHVPMILGEDGSRLSKRHGAVGVMEYERQGYLPEALLNYLIRLGWSHGDQELFSLEEMIELFDIKDVNRAASAFNVDKLRWVNQQHMLRADPQRLAKLLQAELQQRGIDIPDGLDLALVATVYRDRASTIVEMVDECLYLFSETVVYDEKAARKHLRPVVLEPMVKLESVLENLADWRKETIEAELNNVLTEYELKMPKLALPLRVATVGVASSPSIGVTLELVGKQATLSRIESALSYIRQRIEQSN